MRSRGGPLLHTHCYCLSLLSVCVSAGVVSWRVMWVRATSDAGRAPAVTHLTAARTPVGVRWRHRHRRDTTEQQIFFSDGKYFYMKGNIFNQSTFKWRHKASTTVSVLNLFQVQGTRKKNITVDVDCQYNYGPVVIKFLLYQIYEAFSSTCYSILSS